MELLAFHISPLPLNLLYLLPYLLMITISFYFKI